MTVPWKHPTKLTDRFRAWVEVACGNCGIYPPITNDWRDPVFTDPGASKTSRHLFGEGVDFDIPRTGHSGIVGPLVVALIWERALQAGLMMPPFAEFMAACREVEIELVASAKDSHLHVALDPGQKAPAIFGATD